VEASVATLPRAHVHPAGPAPAPVSLWTAYAVLFASTSVVIGVLWDISWHQSIGRDTFWSPPHMAIYLGGIVAGVACGVHVLRTSFARSAAAERARSATVGFWKYFHGHLGAWLCIWGAIAMLTSAPFDDWWHNAYGLDVKILSPPHAVLALGILAIQLGAMFMVLAYQNRAEAASGTDSLARTLRWLYAYAAALVLLNFATMVSEYTWRIFQHGALFWQIAAGVLLMPLAAAAVSGRLRWPATTTAGMYFAVLLLLTWIFPLFPAEPKLAPVRFALTQMMPPQFPLLLFVPAIGLDLVLQRWNRARGWALAAVFSVVFLSLLLVVQWPFASFLNSGYARTPLFGQHLRPYMVPATSAFAEGRFVDTDTGVALARGLVIALGLGVISARIGVAWGEWMRRVQR
jgi:hypothetical protein